jgi:GNAT superfamily N-acetyltransferase
MSEWRRATAADADGLADLERDANLVALAHVFPPADHPFPLDGVLARWRAVLAEAGTVVEVVDGPGRLDAFLAHDATTLRHLAVHPDRWGSGLGAHAVRRATEAGATRLWCLAANSRARDLYERCGWTAGGQQRAAEWPPHPLEIEYVRDEPIAPLVTSEG